MIVLHPLCTVWFMRSGSPFTDPNFSRSHRDQDPRTFRPTLKVVIAALILGAVLNPQATEMGLAMLIAMTVVVLLLIARALLRTLRRPIGSLTVLDVTLGSMILRWWSRLKPR